MINVVSDIFVRSGCPKALRPLAGELSALAGHCFTDDGSLRRFVRSLADRVGPCFSVTHERDAAGGTVSVVRHDLSPGHYVRLRYLRILGKVDVGRSGRIRTFSLNNQDIIDL